MCLKLSKNLRYIELLTIEVRTVNNWFVSKEKQLADIYYIQLRYVAITIGYQNVRCCSLDTLSGRIDRTTSTVLRERKAGCNLHQDVLTQNLLHPMP